MAVAESLVRTIIERPLEYSGWTVQGLGMLRLELDDTRVDRLHIWDPSKELNSVRSAHDHPWDIEESAIYFGFMGNQRFWESDTGAIPMRAQAVQCGIGSRLLGDPRPVLLEAGPMEGYEPGERYSMGAEEKHDSFPVPGTTTVIRRRFRDDRNIATICWEGEGAWQEEGFTRVATVGEILHFTGLAQQLMRSQ
jgi:hypothetical protein